VATYVQNLTRPGDLVVDLFCQGPALVREAAAAGRRALGLSVNPVLLVAAHKGVGWLDATALNTAFTHLADSLKGEIPLHRYLTSLYRSACPACKSPGIAVWFAWDRDGGYPFRKGVRCPRCDGIQEGEPDDEDVESAHRTAPRGLAYYYALDRAAPPGHPARERAAELVELYTPRNLAALMDLAMRLEGLEADREIKIALTVVLLDCFDACSSLDHYSEKGVQLSAPLHRPRTLRIPPLYLERNVWLCFEDCFSRLLAERPSAPLQRAADVAALVKGEAQGYALASHAARDVQKVIRPASVALVVADPPRPDAVFWALSALWACWLWDAPAAHAMRPFLRRRRFDWEWHWRVLRMALNAVGPLLTPSGYLVTLFYEPDDALMESIALAASSAGYSLVGWGYSAESGYRLAWRWEGAQPMPPTDAQTLEQDLLTLAKDAAVSGLRARGEPAVWSLVHAGVYAELARSGLLARAAAIPETSTPPFTFVTGAVRRAPAATPLVPLTDRDESALWWLADVSRAAEPLADQIEAQVRELLLRQPTWQLDELVNAVYACFSGPLTPDLPLVLVCIDSYSLSEGGALRLRSEDDPLQRAAELRVLCADLEALGKRLGFRVKRKGAWDVRWLEEGREVYLFAVSSTATLGSHLLDRRKAAEGAQRCLVLPGGRAQLATFKLQRDPRLRRAVEIDGWQFIKFRHLRRLLAEEELDRYALKTVLGLDPIVEREATQIPLF
jgi:hypothetical protein